MARRRTPTPPPAEAGVILPKHLVERIPYTSRENAEAARDQRRERDQWLREHGVDVGDFRAVRAILTASELAHGLFASDALSRARRRSLFGVRE